ncbi:Fic/DOC family protein [Streptomyces sp. NBC_01530]|uniref:Fic/DOC family protein n=1 Tax=Streptomyces sp. NBC_01530 TaxID=2903895 RepID=UPI00386816C9
MNDPYAMPNGVLRNKLGITDHQLLAAAEADITRARLVLLAERPLPGAYDLGHLQAFHATIFGDIYPWAGELRTVNIAKRTPFCPVRNLMPYAAEVFGRLASSGHLRDLPRQEFVIRLAALYGDLNVIHPFREGNGRTQRAFAVSGRWHGGAWEAGGDGRWWCSQQAQAGEWPAVAVRKRRPW